MHKRWIGFIAFLSTLAAGFAVPLHAARLNIVTTTPDLADIAGRIGGDRAQVTALSKGEQDPHFVEAKPSLILKLMKADLFVQTGLELEIGWAPSLLQGARNAKIQPGGAGFLDASKFIAPEEVPQNASRAEGDVHPGGNPHYLTDPENARPVARALAEKLVRLSPADKGVFEENLRAFESLLDDHLKKWAALMEPARGAKFVSHHRNLTYFAKRYGLVSAGEIEPKPGIPPTASHTAKLIHRMKAEGVRLVITQTFYEPRAAESIAEATGARVIVFALAPGGAPGADDYFNAVETNVRAVVQALTAARPR